MVSETLVVELERAELILVSAWKYPNHINLDVEEMVIKTRHTVKSGNLTHLVQEHMQAFSDCL